jgi:hypothetical protein
VSISLQFILSHNVVLSTPCLSGIRTHNVSGDRHWLQGRIQRGAHLARAPPKIGKNILFWRKIVIFHTKYPKNFRTSLRKWKKIVLFGVKSWFFTRNTSKIVAPPSARRNFFKCAPLTWNPGSAPGNYHWGSIIFWPKKKIKGEAVLQLFIRNSTLKINQLCYV